MIVLLLYMYILQFLLQVLKPFMRVLV